MISFPLVPDARNNQSMDIFRIRITELKLPEREARLIDGDKVLSMEKKKTERYS